MSSKTDSHGEATIDSPPASSGKRAVNQNSATTPGFIQRYRLPLFLAVVAICLYAGSILYMVFARGQVA